MWHYINKKKENFGLSKHLSVAQVELSHEIGSRDTATFRRLYKKVSKITGNCIFYTNNWDSFAKVLPQDRHMIGKSHTSAIERDNSNTRHNIARFTRKTKVVSHKKEMVDKSIKLWLSFQNHVVFDKYR